MISIWKTLRINFLTRRIEMNRMSHKFSDFFFSVATLVALFSIKVNDEEKKTFCHALIVVNFLSLVQLFEIDFQSLHSERKSSKEGGLGKHWLSLLKLCVLQLCWKCWFSIKENHFVTLNDFSRLCFMAWVTRYNFPNRAWLLRCCNVCVCAANNKR